MSFNRIFCIGPNKTGTTSLHRAFQTLGLHSCHDPYLFNTAVAKAQSEERRLLHFINHFDAFSDSLMPYGISTDPLLSFRNLKLLLSRLCSEYPASRFILNVRDVDEWISSRRKHVEANLRNPDYRGAWTEISEVEWRTEMECIQSQTTEFFRDRPEQLLTIDVCAGDGWETLCPFLGLPVPHLPFPHSNSSAERPASSIDSLRNQSQK